MRFVTDAFNEKEANVVVIGVDCPESLREVSQLVEPFDIDEQKNLIENVRIYDSGDVKIEELESKLKDVVSANKLPLVLAKNHTVTLHAMKAMPDNTKLVVFDAHADLKDEYEGSKYSHASWLRRLCELSKNYENIVIIGLRSCDEEELEFMKSNGILCFTTRKIKSDFENVKKRLGDSIGNSPFYMSIDMDVFDPSIAPAVKYAEPEGLTYKEFLSIIQSIKGKLSGLDCVEIRPLGKNKITEFLAVKILFKVLGV